MVSDSVQVRLHGRTILITGASTGLGERFARSAASAGAAVVLGARRADLVESVASEIRAEGARAMALALDVADEASVRDCFERAEAELGPVSGVVANAGINLEATALDLSVEDFDRIVGVNLRGAFLTVREGARRMLAAKASGAPGGRIVIISSILARTVYRHSAPYSATKAAVVQMGRVLARDWARHGICVNMLSPGSIETNITRDWFASELGRKHVARMPRQRLQSAQSLDPMLLYLLSDAAAEITGSEFVIDDGQTLN